MKTDVILCRKGLKIDSKLWVFEVSLWGDSSQLGVRVGVTSLGKEWVTDGVGKRLYTNTEKNVLLYILLQGLHSCRKTRR